jgi:1-acyl-sn-glycerol-3-phosphate acyltransferase
VSIDGPEFVADLITHMRRFLGTSVLRWMGWKIEGALPSCRKYVVIAAPHTSNWDFIVGIAAMFQLRLHVHWLGKHTLFRWPFGGFFKCLGGIPVDRVSSEGVVELMVRNFQQHDEFILGLSPEGTRKKVDQWKTGFYYIASGAGVPIVPVSFDYSKRVIMIHSSFSPTGNLEQDLAALQSLFSSKMAKHPELFSPRNDS